MIKSNKIKNIKVIKAMILNNLMRINQTLIKMNQMIHTHQRVMRVVSHFTMIHQSSQILTIQIKKD